MAELTTNLGLNVPGDNDFITDDKFWLENLSKIDDAFGAGGLANVVMDEYEWTASAGQLVFTLPSGKTYNTTTKWFDVAIGGASVKPSLVEKTNATQFTLLVDPSEVPEGISVWVRWVNPSTPALDDARFDVIETDVASNTQLIDNKGVDVTKFKHLVTNLGLSNEDWQPAIQAAITEAVETETYSIFFPSGTYLIQSTVNLPTLEAIDFVGQSTKWTFIKAGSVMTNMIYKIGTSMSLNGEIKGISFDGSYKADNMIYLEKSRNYKIHSNKFFRFKESAITLNHPGATGASTYGHHIFDNEFRGATEGESGLVIPNYIIKLMSGATDNHIYHNSLANCKEAMIYDPTGGNNRIEGNHFFSFPAPDFTPTQYIYSEMATTISNNYFDTPKIGVYHKGDNFTIQDNYFYWSRNTNSNFNVIGIQCVQNATNWIKKAIVANNRFDAGNNVTFTNDVLMGAMYVDEAIIENNVSDATTKYNNPFVKPLLKRRATSTSIGLATNDIATMLVELFSSGALQLTHKNETTGTTISSVLFDNTQTKFTQALISDKWITPLRTTTANRPTTGMLQGSMVYDTTLGKPIWWSGSAWKDAMGTTV